MPRFNKKKLIADLYERADKIKSQYSFDTGNGYAQVTGKGDDVNRAYGEWQTLLKIARDAEDGYIGC